MQFYSHYIWESGSEEKENPVSIVLQQVSLKNNHYLLACVCDGGKSVCGTHIREETVSEKDISGKTVSETDVVGTNFNEKNDCINNKTTETEYRKVIPRGGSIVSGYFTERLVEWFHHHYLEILQKSGGEKSVIKSLSAELDRIDQELMEYGRQKGTRIIYDVLGIFIYDNLCWIFGQGECQGYLFNRRFNKKQRRRLPCGNGKDLEITQGKIQKNIGIMLCNANFGEQLKEEEMVQVMFDEHLGDRDIQKRLRELWKEDERRGNTAAAAAVYIEAE